MFPAFKEWHTLVEALGSGEQLLILRKGGIAEGRGGFDSTRARRFWLFPTQFHAQREKVKPAAARFFAAASTTAPAPAAAAEATVELRYFADVTHHAFLADWSAVAALDPFHFWTESAVREKFEWSQPPGLHVFVVRVHRLDTALTFAPTPAIAGCKSWIDLPYSPDDYASTPVLDAAAFTARSCALGL